ncbi:MAG: CoA pyrophosphatase [Bacteroidia bacterium]|nr:CoA pyrophosphatase [Bacteroidia bacterium]MDW8333492.1 CoA pyrophosphatase [Bacteroidia bacterium]
MRRSEEFAELAHFLRERLERPLPGPKAHLAMAPYPKLLVGEGRREVEIKEWKAPEGARRGAVLCLLGPDANGKPSVLLTRRSDKLKHHRGQISFPGGGVDAGETPLQAALREAREEVGLSDESFVVLGALSNLYIPPSGNFVTPFLATASTVLDPVPDPEEVEEVFWVKIELLARPETLKRSELIRPNYGLVPYFDVHPHVPLWGATAMMLNELLEVWKEFRG